MAAGGVNRSTAALLAVTAAAAALAAALLWRAHAEPLAPLLEGADALAAEGQRLLDQGKTFEAAARFGEGVALDPQHVASLVGRARARALAGEDPGVVRGDLERALSIDPRSTTALRALADHRLSRGDVKGAREALDRALEATAGAAAGAEVDRVADVRQRVAAAAKAEEAALERAETLLAQLDGRGITVLEAARAASPESAPLHAALSRALTDVGRYADAATAAVEAGRLDHTQALDDGPLQRLRLLARDAAATPGAPPPADRWWAFLGGVWRDEGGVISGQVEGQGVFGLATLVSHEAPPGAEFSVSTEVSLVSGNPGPYAGLLVGARSTLDLFAVYVFHDGEQARARIDAAELDAYRQKHGAWPKFVRVARVADGRWQHRATLPVSFPDAGWVALRLDVRGHELTVTVDGQRLEPMRLDRPLDGRVGLVKYYDTVARWRTFTLESRR